MPSPTGPSSTPSSTPPRGRRGSPSTTAAGWAWAGPSMPARSRWPTGASWRPRSWPGSSPTTPARGSCATWTPATPRPRPWLRAAACASPCASTRDGGPRVSSFLHPPCPLAEAARQGLRAGLEALAPIGRDPGTGGYWRFSWTPEDQRLRAWFAARAEASGMAHEQDGNGNLWAWWGDPAAGAAIATGSHLDSVPGGGAYDGRLGVVSGFVALDLLRARGVPPARPLAVVAWCEEEGGRFGVACLGSRLATGAIDPDQAR